MKVQDTYASPLGTILLEADEEGLSGLWFEGAKYCGERDEKDTGEETAPVLADAKKWLDVYFSGKDPGRFAPLHLVGTAFQKKVWNILLSIPYGETTTYGKIAEEIAEEEGKSRMSAQAVGAAVGHNRISLIIPCHRVIGSDGCLVGYAGGVERKRALLALEHALTDRMYVPKHGTAL